MGETFYNLTVATTNAEDMRNLLNNLGEVPSDGMPVSGEGQMSVLSISDIAETCEGKCCGGKDGVCNCGPECDCGPQCGCHDHGDKEVNEINRMKELAGMVEGPDDYDEGPGTLLHSELQGNPRDTIEIFNSQQGGMVAEQLANILGYDYKWSQWGGDGEQKPMEEQNSNALKIILKFLRNRGEDDVANEIDEYLHGEREMDEDGYDYRKMGKPEPNDFDRKGNDFDAFARKGHVKKSKKRVNDYGDNPMAEEKVNEETDEDGNWIKPWEKKDDDNKDDDKEEVDEGIDNELFEKLLDEYEEFKLDEAVSQWIIMNATKKVFGKIRMSLDEIISSEYFDNGCIMVVNFDHGQSVFIYGSGQKPYGVVGETKDFVQDTGRGYGRRGQLEIENFAVITDGEIMTTANSLGLNEKRPLWVFK